MHFVLIFSLKLKIKIANSTFMYPNMLGEPCVEVTRNPLSVRALSETQMEVSDKLEDIILYVRSLHTIAIPDMIINQV